VLAGRRISHHGRVSPATREHLIEQGEIALDDGIRKRFSERFADHGSMANQLHVGRISEVKYLVWTFEHGDKSRRLLEHLLEPFVLASQQPFSPNLGRCLNDDRNHADRTRALARIGE
jgi:hypothetical protein